MIKHRIVTIWRKLIEDEDGQVAAEYFMLVIIGVAFGIIGIPLIGAKIGELFQVGVVREITKPFH